MPLIELLPLLRELLCAGKLRLIQFLVVELAREEDIDLINEGNYPVWSPYSAFEAADALLDALEQDKIGQSRSSAFSVVTNR